MDDGKIATFSEYNFLDRPACCVYAISSPESEERISYSRLGGHRFRLNPDSLHESKSSSWAVSEIKILPFHSQDLIQSVFMPPVCHFYGTKVG